MRKENWKTQLQMESAQSFILGMKQTQEQQQLFFTDRCLLNNRAKRPPDYPFVSEEAVTEDTGEHLT
jgi:hypothetical protein